MAGLWAEGGDIASARLDREGLRRGAGPMKRMPLSGRGDFGGKDCGRKGHGTCAAQKEASDCSAVTQWERAGGEARSPGTCHPPTVFSWADCVDFSEP